MSFGKDASSIQSIVGQNIAATGDSQVFLAFESLEVDPFSDNQTRHAASDYSFFIRTYLNCLSQCNVSHLGLMFISSGLETQSLVFQHSGFSN